MEDFTVKIEFPINGTNDRTSLDQAIRTLGNNKGITEAFLKENILIVEYYSQIIGEEALRVLIGQSGLRLAEEPDAPEKRERNPVKRYINRLAKSNEKRFGNRRLDCCDLNRKEA